MLRHTSLHNIMPGGVAVNEDEHEVLLLRCLSLRVFYDHNHSSLSSPSFLAALCNIHQTSSIFPLFLSSSLLSSPFFSFFFLPFSCQRHFKNQQSLKQVTICHTSFSVIPLSQSYFVFSHTSFSVIPLSQSYLFLSHTSFSVIPLFQSYLFLSHTSFSVIIPCHRVIAFYVIYTLLFPLFHLFLPFFL